VSKITRPIPAGHEGLIPHLVCDPCADAIEFWGDRYGVVTDPFGHNWSFATHLKDLTPAEAQVAMREAFAQRS
jgi:hypothetical protein